MYDRLATVRSLLLLLLKLFNSSSPLVRENTEGNKGEDGFKESL